MALAKQEKPSPLPSPGVPREGIIAKPPRNADLLNRVRGVAHALAPIGLNIGRGRPAPFPTIERDGFQAQCLRDWPADPDFPEKWKALAAKSPAAHPFQSPIWQAAIVNQFVPRKQFRLLTVHRGEELQAVLPLGFSSNGLLETPGRYASDYLDPAIDPKNESACWTIMLELLAKLWDWSVAGVVLANLRSQAPCRSILPAIAAKLGFTCEESTLGGVARINLPATWELYLEMLDGHERKETKRKVRNAMTKGHAELTPCADITQLMACLRESLTDMEFGSKPRKAKFTEEALRPLLLGAAPALFEAGILKLLNLTIEGKSCASLFVMTSPTGPMIYNTSYDASAKQWSPGAVAFAMAIQQAIEQQATVFDLLRGTEDYKLKIGAVVEPLYRIALRR